MDNYVIFSLFFSNTQENSVSLHYEEYIELQQFF
jgi:hypothetical protein